MKKILLAIVLLSTYVSVIAQPNETQVEIKPASIQPVIGLVSLAEPVICCKQYSELVRTAIPKNATELVLDAKSPQFDFGKGIQSYFLIELPTYTQPYSFSITNLPQKIETFNSSKFTQMALIIETFDSNFVAKRVYKHEGMKKRGIGYDKTVFINPQNQTERYVLIYGDTSVAPEEVTISQTDIVFVGTGFFIGGEDKKISLTPSDKGVLKIEAKGLLLAEK